MSFPVTNVQMNTHHTHPRASAQSLPRRTVQPSQQAGGTGLLSPCPGAVSPTITQGRGGRTAELISHCSCLTTLNCMAGGLHTNSGKTGHPFQRAISSHHPPSASLSINHPPKTAEWQSPRPEVKGALPWLDLS